MTALRPLIASLPLTALALAATVAAAQTPVPRPTGGGVYAGGAFSELAVVTARAAESRALISALIAAYYPTALQPNSEIRRIAFVLDSSDAYVTSAAIKVASGAVLDTAASLQYSRPEAAMTARASAAPRLTEVPVNIDLTAFGLGVIDGDAVRGTASSKYRAGVITPGALDVYIVRLK